MSVNPISFQGNQPVEHKKNHTALKAAGVLAGSTAAGALGGLACDTLVIKRLKDKNFLKQVKEGLGSGEGEKIFKELYSSAKDIARNKAFTKTGALFAFAGASTTLALYGLVKLIKNSKNKNEPKLKEVKEKDKDGRDVVKHYMSNGEFAYSVTDLGTKEENKNLLDIDKLFCDLDKEGIKYTINENHEKNPDNTYMKSVTIKEPQTGLKRVYEFQYDCKTNKPVFYRECVFDEKDQLVRTYDTDEKGHETMMSFNEEI